MNSPTRTRRPLVLLLAVAVAQSTLPARAQAQKHELVHAKDGSGVVGYKHTPIQPWSGFHVHDPDRPAPPVVQVPPPSAAELTPPPSDALVLFDGRDLTRWEPNQWRIEDACLVATEGPMRTRESFGDCQLHLEWMAPAQPAESIWNRGNNGVFLLGRIEVQIFDSSEGGIYPDGQAAAVYAQTPPLVNACRKPGEWQSYDLVFVAPKFDAAGKLTAPARLTMFHNGILVHHHQEIYGSTPHAGLATYQGVPASGPVALGAHHCPVRFRNIWLRRL